MARAGRSLRTATNRRQLPALLIFTSRAPACAAESPKLSLPGAAPGRLANGVVADKQCTCPASRLMWERYPPTPPISPRETRPMHREKPHKLLQVGVTPTPATIFG